MTLHTNDESPTPEVSVDSESCNREVRAESPLKTPSSLAGLIDAPALQSMMDDFYEITSIPMSLVDTRGEVIVGAGWQKVCMDFHRSNPVTCAHCVESDTALTTDIPMGEARLYRCRNGMWDAASPVEINGEHIANVFTGQFFMSDESIDFEYFAAQAAEYGFPEREYLDAVAAVPRLDRKHVDGGLRFLTKLAHMLSCSAYANHELAQVITARDALLEREREQTRRLMALSDTESALTSSLELREVVDLALRAAQQHLGVCAASVWTKSGERLVIAGARGFPDGFLKDFEDGVGLTEPFPVAQAAREKRGVLFESADDGLHEPVLAAYERYGIEIAALAAFPLIARGEAIGGITLAWNRRRSFSPEDVSLIETLASRFAVAIDNAQLFEAEHVIAQTLQDTLVVLPETVPGIAFSRAYASSTFEKGRVGGDFVDVFPVGDAVVGIALGDVSGKGLSAAVTTSLVRTTLRVHAIDGLPVAEVLMKTNTVMRRFTDLESFVTLWFGLLNTDTGHLRYAIAGHPPAIVVAPNSVTEIGRADPILGAFDDTDYYECRAVLTEDERLLLYSDGVTEARSPDGSFMNADGLHELARLHHGERTEDLAQSIMDDVISYSQGVLRDDAAILVVALSGAAAASM